MEDPTKVIDLDEERAKRDELAKRREDNLAAHARAGKLARDYDELLAAIRASERIVPDKVDAPKPQGDGPPKDVTRVPPKRGRRGKKAPAHAPYLFRNMAKNVKDGRRGHIEALR